MLWRTQLFCITITLPPPLSSLSQYVRGLYAYGDKMVSLEPNKHHIFRGYYWWYSGQCLVTHSLDKQETYYSAAFDDFHVVNLPILADSKLQCDIVECSVGKRSSQSWWNTICASSIPPDTIQSQEELILFFRKEKFSQKPLNSLMSHWSGLHLVPIPKHITTTMIDHDCWRRLILIHSWKQFYRVLTKFYRFKFKVSIKMKMLSINIL